GSCELQARARCSWDLHLADGRDGGAGGDEKGQERERIRRAGRLALPSDGVAAAAAGCDRRPPAQRTVISLEGNERDSALVGLVAVVKEEARHDASLPSRSPHHIGATP